MSQSVTVEEAAGLLLKADRILLLTHQYPDGDTIGSGYALCRALQSLGKTARVACSDEIPDKYAYMTQTVPSPAFEPAFICAVDVADAKLLGPRLAPYAERVDLAIDHHASHRDFQRYLLLDAAAPATALLIYDLLPCLGAALTPFIADCLYTGLATDTGCFRFSSTTAKTHLVAAKLIEAGCHVEELNTLLFDTKPRARMEAERIARNHLEYYLDGRCALIYLTRDEIRQSGVDPADLEELTSLPISIEGVKVGLTLRQQPGGSYRISVRTAKSVDACAIARRLGGGGHTRAAGCELLGDLENAKNAILAEVEAELDAPQEEA